MATIEDCLREHIQLSVYNAFHNESKLSIDVLNIDGMSGNKTRHLLNNICTLPNKTYLEVGTYKGSSFISALFDNDIHGFCIDNWGQFGGKDEFISNINKFTSHLPTNLNIIDKDCWTVTTNDISKSIDIFMYDGVHTYEDQKKAITYFQPILSEYCIIIIDDWKCDWVKVRDGTFDGLQESGLKVLYKEEIGLVNTDTYHQGGDTFWNGCGIFLCHNPCKTKNVN